MKDSNSNQEELSEELPAGIEGQAPSPPVPSRITSESRLDSTGLPVPAAPANTPPVTPMVAQPKTQETYSNVTDGSSLPSKATTALDTTISKEDEEVKGPKTPDTETSCKGTDSSQSVSTPTKLACTTFSTEDEGVKGGAVRTSKLHKEEGGDAGSDTSGTIVQENSAEDSKKFFEKKNFAMIAMVLMVLVVIIVVVSTFVVLFGESNEEVVSAAKSADWSTVQPTVSVPLEANVPTQGPTHIIDLDPTPTSSPTLESSTNRPTQTPTRSTSNSTTAPTGLIAEPVPSLPTLAPLLTSPTNRAPTRRPTPNPTKRPTQRPTTPIPTRRPTQRPTTSAPNQTPTPTTRRPTQRPTTAAPATTPTPTTRRPTQRPTTAAPATTPNPTTKRPTQRPTLAPAPSPATNTSFEKSIIDFLLLDNSDIRGDSSVEKAVDWLVAEANAAGSIPFNLGQKYKQRFGILILYFSVDPNVQATNSDTARLPNRDMRNQNACNWRGMTCNTDLILTSIKLSKRQLDGSLPSIWRFFPNLKSIDFSTNKLKGGIPEEMYEIAGLEKIFLYKNQLSGTISRKIGNLWSLTRFHLSHNRLSGSIPPELASTETKPRPIRYFNVHRNQMTGSIPANLRWRQLLILDLGNNQFAGEVPPEFGTQSIRLRHLYLDNNKFSGTFPSTALNAGDGRLNSLFVNNNEFSGTFPGDHKSLTAMTEMTIQNNNFVAMQRNSTCDLDVFSGGELIEFKSKCLICRCSQSLMCRFCVVQ
ncbi:MAG: hypothetical protein SGBAC_004000 [Bacillariaceae sp.]